MQISQHQPVNDKTIVNSAPRVESPWGGGGTNFDELTRHKFYLFQLTWKYAFYISEILHVLLFCPHCYALFTYCEFQFRYFFISLEVHRTTERLVDSFCTLGITKKNLFNPMNPSWRLSDTFFVFVQLSST